MLRRFALLTPCALLLLTAARALADDAKPAGDKTPAANSSSNAAAAKSSDTKAEAGAAAAEAGAAGAAAGEVKPKYAPFATVTKDYKPVQGPSLIPLYQKEGSVLAEFAPHTLNNDFIVLISIARGIGHGHILGGMSWGIGDDWIWQFRKVDDHIHVVRRNVRFTATKGSPEEKAVGIAYTDSVLFSLPIATISPSGGYVVDLTQVFMSDLPQISHDLPGFSFAGQRRPGPRSRAIPTTSNWKSPPPTPPAA